MIPTAYSVQFILDACYDDVAHKSHPIFSEMMELTKDGDDIEWKESARWVKYEEVVEEGGDRWSKPYVTTLSLHSLFELRNLLTNGACMLDVMASNMEEIAELVCANMTNAGSLSFDSRENVCKTLLRHHRHQYQRKNFKKSMLNN